LGGLTVPAEMCHNDILIRKDKERLDLHEKVGESDRRDVRSKGWVTPGAKHQVIACVLAAWTFFVWLGRNFRGKGPITLGQDFAGDGPRQ